MTIEMYNAIKSQYFTSKSSEEEGDSEGVVFEVGDTTTPSYFHIPVFAEQKIGKVKQIYQSIGYKFRLKLKTLPGQYG